MTYINSESCSKKVIAPENKGDHITHANAGSQNKLTCALVSHRDLCWYMIGNCQYLPSVLGQANVLVMLHKHFNDFLSETKGREE